MSEWMSNKRYLDLSPGDVAVRLDLISKIHGLEQAEKYFSNIPITLRDLRVYGALFNGYAHAKSLEKEDATMQKRRELGFVTTSLPYNVIRTLYADMEGMDKLLMKMEVDPDVNMDWYSYIVAANGYLRASCIGKKNEVYRIWDLYKKTGKVYNMSYLSMISALAKLDDLDGAEKIWEEWQAKKEHFDFRVPNLVIKAYCKKSLLGKAKSILNRLVERVVRSPLEAYGSTWPLGYQEDHQMEKAL
ncbi:tetratricopeptide repeat (TPR)-like superfamily protein [Actinidia rufa]|uniref:Tetratricopeptide repeat (TPR)-like superfamily protein n=1 Tax=Actinidia rufa TaxID=165716 RepID=A0A7J0FK21_9ERIC|nr:tetratricopeptide repeat (TPR)-like superfamily protein [Actinidia rufa]